MPNPNRYDNKQSWMEDCMHQVKTVEGKSQDQSVAQCLSMWRNRDKDATILNNISNSLDKIASNVQKKGLSDIAKEIDIVANTVDHINDEG